MRVPLVAGNWKMNGTRAAARDLAASVASAASATDGVEVAVCPSFVFLADVAVAIEGSSCLLGAQNVCDRDQGAFTGEVAGDMLAEFGCRFVIVGHSERRHVYGEGDALVAGRFAAAKRHALVPILCVGETLEEREAGRTNDILARQLDAVLECCGSGAFGDAVVAYEPVWAIGTGRTATPEQAQEAHAFIRQRIASVNADAASALRILYGGSMKPEKAVDLLARDDVDGGLVGGASLDAADFAAICRAAVR